MNKFYHALNAHQPVKSKSGRVYQFELCQFIGGTWTGVLVARTDEEKADLSEIASRLKSVREIDEAEWRRCIKARSAPAGNTLLSESTRGIDIQPAEAEPQPVPIKTIEPLASVEAALNVGPVSIQPAPEPPEPVAPPAPVATQPQVPLTAETKRRRKQLL